MQKLLDASFPDGTYNYWKSTFLKELSDDAIELMIAYANNAQSPLSGIMIEFYGGAAGRNCHPDTSFALRQREYNVGILAQWTDAAESDKHISWTRDLWNALSPYSSGGLVLNFSRDTGEEANRAMFGSNYTRLAELKAKYDPANFFSLNVKPPH
jgi:hypothetical protein